ncbi:MAG: hypothetical protein HDR26_10695 [Lachnospiraceae bacterium]|nr:hypothetical protein [Lachnospiraceae bacterium]
MDAFREMLELARQKMLSCNAQEHTQIIAALSTCGNFYYKVIHNPLTEELTDEKCFIEELVKNQDTQLKKFICLWANGNIDIPSFHFRKLLCDANCLTSETEILLQSVDGYIIKTYSQIFSIAG